jgi:hypothetical protein
MTIIINNISFSFIETTVKDSPDRTFTNRSIEANYTVYQGHTNELHGVYKMAYPHEVTGLHALLLSNISDSIKELVQAHNEYDNETK